MGLKQKDMMTKLYNNKADLEADLNNKYTELAETKKKAQSYEAKLAEMLENKASAAKEEKKENTESTNEKPEEKGKPTSLIGILKEKTEKMSEEGKTNKTSDLGVDKYPAEDEKVDDASKDV